MKHIKEYKDEEIEDLMGDLSVIGHEKLKGYLLMGGTDSGYFGGTIYFAHNDEELERIVKEEYSRYSSDPNFPIWRDGTYKRGSRAYSSFFFAFRDFISYMEIYMSSYALADLKPKNPGQVPGRINFGADNPYLTADFLDKHFSNARERLTAEDFKEDFEEEMGIIPLKK
jgi:hypothetical protein